MIKNIDKYSILVKFGKREHLEQLQIGNMYFSPLKRFQKMELELNKKGRGDINDGMNSIFAKNVKIIPMNNDGTYNYNDQIFLPKANLSYRYCGTEFIPVFCLTKVEILNIKTGEIDITESDFNRILEDFYDADSALVIYDIDTFLENVKKNIGTSSFSHDVFYENVESIQFLNFVTCDKTMLTNNPSQYIITTNNMHKTLYKKSEYFKHQSEFRITLFKESIYEPKIYKIDQIINSRIVPINELFISLKNY